MPTTLDCLVMRNVFGSDRMRQVFDSRNMIQSWFETWACLAEAQADVGMIPAEAAAEIRAATRRDDYDAEEIGRKIATGRHFLMPSINALTAASGESGRYVHWGATTQDITDTGMMLQIRQAMAIVEPAAEEITAIVARLAARYRDQPMAGRTHWQHAVPMTFGFKLAQWVDELERHRERLARARADVLVAELGGAGGTLASLGDKADPVLDAFCRRIGLAKPGVAWHGSRDRLAALVNELGMLAAMLEKICLEVGRLSSAEIGELHEPRNKGQVGSSTMPQKHNPILCERSAAGCRLVRGMVPVMQSLMIGVHERDMASVAAEWLLIPQCFIVLDGSLQYTHTILSGLQVFPARMDANLGITRGGIAAEAVMFGLAQQLGRTEAHDLMVEVAREAMEQRRDLGEVLSEHPTAREVLSAEEIARLVDPTNHLGLSQRIVDRVLADRDARSGQA
jgi:3-carboxy-cis,cis-muconate cycloisomerase